MSKPAKTDTHRCCSMEKRRLIDDIRKCDFCSTSWESHHRCLSAAAKRSGERSRACLMS